MYLLQFSPQSANEPRINWYKLCKNPVVDILISQPCGELTTNGGFTLTPEGERVLACLGGGAATVLAGAPQLLALKNHVGCEDRTSGSGFGSHSSNLAITGITTRLVI